MNVKEVMSRETKTIRMVDRLDTAARILWENDCGIVPVVDGNQALVGVVTDRDLCMAAYTQGRPLGEIPVTAVMARNAATCKPDDPVATAMQTLQQRQVHRLPVVDARNVVVGMLSISDLVRVAHTRPAGLDGGSVLKTIASITAPRRAAPAPTLVAPVASVTPAAATASIPAPAAKVAAVSAPAPIAAAPQAAAKSSKPAKAEKSKGKGRKN